MSLRSVPARVVLPAAVLLAACAGNRQKGPAAAAPAPAVSADDIQRNPNVPVEQILSGRIAGVTVQRGQDGGLVVRVRGSTSFSASEEPLYVVDGTPIAAGPGGSLSGISPYDIESISVLKDAASLTMYGSRGANGVILIKMKKAGGNTRRP